MSLLQSLERLKAGRNLDEPGMVNAMQSIMAGDETDIDIAEFLTMLAQKGETPGEIAGAARVMRAKAATIESPPGTIDCCGTGGDGLGTYNISTASALVAAACGVPVAKHGNRASSSKSGAADVLEALGVRLDVPHEKLAEALRTIRFAFLMAPHHHAAMRHVMPVRKALGFRTIFNLLGPLANPAGAKIQLIGVYGRKWVRPLAETMRLLGAESAWIVHGGDGLDEITLTGPTYMARLENGGIQEGILHPSDFDLPALSSLDLLRGGDARENAEALKALISGTKSAYRDIVLANAAAILILAKKVQTFPEGVQMAAAAIDSGEAMRVLEQYKTFTKGSP